jgi:hypothetical protein
MLELKQPYKKERGDCMNDTQYRDDQWVTMSEAAQRLGIQYNRITRLASKGKIETRTDMLDERAKLVNLEELKRVFRIRD